MQRIDGSPQLDISVVSSHEVSQVQKRPSYMGAEATVIYIPHEDGPGQLLSRQRSMARTRNIDVAPGQVLLVGTDAEIDAAIAELGMVPFVRPAIPQEDADALRAQQLLNARDRIDVELADPKFQVAVERMQSTVGKVHP